MTEKETKKADSTVEEPKVATVDAEPSEETAINSHANDDEKADEQRTVSDAERLKELNDKFLRTLADIENMRRRHERELDEARKYAATGFARDLLDVADNMRRALSSVPPEATQDNELLKTLVTGVEITERSLLGAFEKHRISRVEPQKGEKFDPNRHQAMFEVATDELPPGVVAEVMQTGYVMAGRLLRPAMVGVSKALPKPATQPEPASGDKAEVGTKVDTTA